MSGKPPLLVPFSALKGFGIDLSRDTVRRLVKAGKFPAPRMIGGHRIAWLLSEILEWIATRPIAEPRGPRVKGGGAEGRVLRCLCGRRAVFQGRALLLLHRISSFLEAREGAG
jgi:hypothetical protein